MSSLQDLLSDLTSGNETRAEKDVPALIELGEEAIPALLDLTRSSEVDHRWWGLRVLAQSPSPSGTSRQAEWLVPFLNDPAREVRQCAALSSLAVNALVKIGKSAVPALIEVVKNASQSARIHALRALAEIKDHRAIPVMMKVMEEDSALLQHWAKEGLDRLGLDMVYMKPA